MVRECENYANVHAASGLGTLAQMCLGVGSCPSELCFYNQFHLSVCGFLEYGRDRFSLLFRNRFVFIWD